MIIGNFHNDVLKDYENALDIFFDAETGAVVEPGREDGAPRFLFTEVTGYALLDFILLFRLSGNPVYIEKTVKSANWIRDHAQDPCGGVLTRYYFEHDNDPKLDDKSFAGRRIFAFDVAICLRGMVAAYVETRDQSYLESAIRMGDFITDTLTNDKGEVHAIYNAAIGAPVEANRSTWSRAPGAFHTKAAEALVDLYDVAPQEKYLSAATAMCEFAMEFQRDNGQFETSAGTTELHPYCYATEGMLHVGRKTGSSKFIKSARRATEWALQQCKDGEIAQTFNSETGEPTSRFRTDALSQVLALGSDLLQMGQISDEYSQTLDDLAARLLSMKVDGNGYFRYGFYEREIGGKIEADTRSYWTNMFCMRGLSKYYLSFLLENTCVAILAGGIGSRIWPISCESRPKPVSLALLGDRSLLTETIRRYTHDYFVRPDNIYILCSKSALEAASIQAGREGVPQANCVLEHEPKGTIPAVNLALQGMPDLAEGQKRLVVISMADNVIQPYESFQAAIAAALISAQENDCLLSIGNPFDKQKTFDERFGHMVYNQRIEESYRSFRVDRFAEKPDREQFESLRELPGSMAWESGAVVFAESYFRSVIPADYETGNLAEHALSLAAPWDEQTDDTMRVATSLLSGNISFEDFGVPGQNVLNFFRGNPQNDRGNGNICLGSTSMVRMLACDNSLVISDERAVDVYGLKNFVVVDSTVTNTVVIMKLEDVHHLPNLYRLFLGSKKYEYYISGGPGALTAEPTTFIEKSPNSRARSEFGLVFAYNFNERLSITRDRDGLKIVNDDLPALVQEDFDLLLSKQEQDPMLVKHLVSVGALASAAADGLGHLSNEGHKILDQLCLYHAFGGYLTEASERQEEAVVGNFKQISRLDRRMLDSSVVAELIRTYGNNNAPHSDELMRYVNENVNSAVEYIRHRRPANADLRDMVVGLIQRQGSPYLFSSFHSNLENMGFGDMEEEVVTIYGCFKIAQIFSNARWLWKKSRRQDASSNIRQGVETARGPIEEYPFVIAFIARWLESSGIEAAPYVNRINQMLMAQDSVFANLMTDLQEGDKDLLSDEIYLGLITRGSDYLAQIGELLASRGAEIASSPGQAYQLRQLLELPRQSRQDCR